MNIQMSWPRAHLFERATGALKQQNSDFLVVERLPESPCGEGEHLWLRVSKDGQNTAWIARQLAKWAGCNQRDVSYAGLKDRNAVTEQTFSIHLPGKVAPDLATLAIEGVTVLDAVRHNRKLKTGQLIGNYFTIRIRNCNEPFEQVAQNWHQLVQLGVPNYFGPQRFGHGGRNVETGVNWLLGKAKLPRHQQSIYLSAVRSYLFNRLLGQRVHDSSWDKLIQGDFAQFTEGKAGFYCEQPSQDDVERCQAGKLSPAASLPGESKDDFPLLEQRERLMLTDAEDVLAALKKNRVSRHFRKLRMFPEQASIEQMDGDPVFSFFLPAGAYATSVIAEIVNWQGNEGGDWNE